jgi:hypothetical protein
MKATDIQGCSLLGTVLRVTQYLTGVWALCFLAHHRGKWLPCKDLQQSLQHLVPQVGERERTSSRCLWRKESKKFQTCSVLMLCPFTFFPFHSDALLFSFLSLHALHFLAHRQYTKSNCIVFTFSWMQCQTEILLIFLRQFIITAHGTWQKDPFILKIH